MRKKNFKRGKFCEHKCKWKLLKNRKNRRRVYLLTLRNHALVRPVKPLFRKQRNKIKKKKKLIIIFGSESRIFETFEY